MANQKLIDLAELSIPTTGDSLYTVKGGQSFQLKSDRFAQTVISEYNVLTENLPAGLMTSGNAEIILQGLNNAALAKISQDRVDVDWTLFVSGYFDIDGGTMYDTYVDTSTFDGGTI